MFIIFGSPRSGTTLLASSLDQNDQLVVLDESDFIIPMAFILDRVKNERVGRRLIAEVIAQTQRFPDTLGRFLQQTEIAGILAEVEYTLSAMLQALYERVAFKAGKHSAGDKPPNDIGFARMLIKNGLVHSPIKVVHIVRDVHDVLMSLAEVQPHDLPELAIFPRWWAQSNLLLQDMYSANPDRYLFIQYEDLVLNPIVEFRRVTNFLGVSFQEAMLDGAARSSRHQGNPRHRNLGLPICQRRGNWRDTMPVELQARCLVQAREALERFGYPLQ